jgi:hypothetical protein
MSSSGASLPSHAATSLTLGNEGSAAVFSLFKHYTIRDETKEVYNIAINNLKQ